MHIKSQLVNCKPNDFVYDFMESEHKKIIY